MADDVAPEGVAGCTKNELGRASHALAMTSPSGWIANTVNGRTIQGPVYGCQADVALLETGCEPLLTCFCCSGIAPKESVPLMFSMRTLCLYSKSTNNFLVFLVPCMGRRYVKQSPNRVLLSHTLDTARSY